MWSEWLKRNKSVLIKSSPFILALFTFSFTQIFRLHPNFTEQYYSQLVYPKIAIVLSNFSSLFPFSIDDLLYVFLIIFLLVQIIITTIKRRPFLKLLLKIGQVLSIVYVLFYWLWGFNYYRPQAVERLSLNNKKPTQEKFEYVLDSIITLTNNFYVSVDSMDIDSCSGEIESSYLQLKEELKLPLPLGKRRPKFITFSNFFASASIAGYYGPFFSEIHINRNLTKWDLAPVMAHEKSHQMGITQEAEANYYAWRATTTSSSAQIKYTGWLYILKYFLRQAKYLDNYEEYIEKIEQPVRNDINAIQEHWIGLRNKKTSRVAKKVNNAYLKTNSIKSGTKNYHQVVQLVMGHFIDP